MEERIYRDERKATSWNILYYEEIAFVPYAPSAAHTGRLSLDSSKLFSQPEPSKVARSDIEHRTSVPKRKREREGET